MNRVDIIIPTFDNPAYLAPCVQSILDFTHGAHYQVLIVNNGAPSSADLIVDPRVTLIEAGGNLGWEGGLLLGLSHSTAPFVLFLNDDTLIPAASLLWLQRMVRHFDDPAVGAVGPASNCVHGAQSIFERDPRLAFTAPFLIGFCLLVRRSVLDQVGGIDPTLPGGDDIDLSIRLRHAGFRLVCDRTVFVYHHGFVTGNRVHGGPEIAGGYNSAEYGARIVAALLEKHGQLKMATLGFV